MSAGIWPNQSASVDKTESVGWARKQKAANRKHLCVYHLTSLPVHKSNFDQFERVCLATFQVFCKGPSPFPNVIYEPFLRWACEIYWMNMWSLPGMSGQVIAVVFGVLWVNRSTRSTIFFNFKHWWKVLKCNRCKTLTIHQGSSCFLIWF